MIAMAVEIGAYTNQIESSTNIFNHFLSVDSWLVSNSKPRRIASKTIFSPKAQITLSLDKIDNVIPSIYFLL